MKQAELDKIIFDRFGDDVKRSDIKQLASEYNLDMSARQSYDEMVSQLLDHINVVECFGEPKSKDIAKKPPASDDKPSDSVKPESNIERVSRRFGVSIAHLKHKQKFGVPYKGVYLI
ncbi:hypothetical protein VCHA35O137_30185 [Vibrio chagasii]|nr:hypothetical protein VCHA35O137_30185 [Vibrio chagasii]CAH7074796.1 hypothetical protein VCHA52P454_10706 [Vibrio chagasii]CAH7444405.1 hypothetical protein VCHA48O429_30193 [Vibrio chagasii]